jgi:hypothetical protein
MSLQENHITQITQFNTKKDHRTHNTKVNRLLSALACELKDLPNDKQMRIDYIVNDLRDGYKFNWLGSVDSYRRLLA